MAGGGEDSGVGDGLGGEGGVSTFGAEMGFVIED